MAMSRQSGGSKSSGDPQAKIKLIAVAVVLTLALAWIVYYMMPSGKPRQLTGKAAEAAQQEYETEAKQVQEQQKKAPTAKATAPPAGS